MHAAEGPQRVDRAVSSPLSIISLGDVGGDGGVTDRATRGACAAVAFVLRCFLARECCTCPSANLATTGRVALSYLIRPSWTCVGACISLPWCLLARRLATTALRHPCVSLLDCPVPGHPCGIDPIPVQQRNNCPGPVRGLAAGPAVVCLCTYVL